MIYLLMTRLMLRRLTATCSFSGARFPGRCIDAFPIGCTTFLHSVWRVFVRNAGYDWNASTPPILRSIAACVADRTGETARTISLCVSSVVMRTMRTSTRRTIWLSWGWRDSMVSVRYQSQCAVQKSKVLANHDVPSLYKYPWFAWSRMSRCMPSLDASGAPQYAGASPGPA